jgi:hypothetical protein
MGEVIDGVVRIATRGACTTLYSTGLRSMPETTVSENEAPSRKQIPGVGAYWIDEDRGRWWSRALVALDMSPGAAMPLLG